MDKTNNLQDLQELLRRHLKEITTLAGWFAAQLVRKLKLPEVDRQDITQELLVEFLTRWPKFRPDKGSVPGFARTIFKNRSSELARKMFIERGLFLSIPISLEADRGLVQEAELAERSYLPDYNRRLMSERCFDRLRAIDLAILNAIASADVTAATRVQSRATLFRRKAELRRRLTMLGLVA